MRGRTFLRARRRVSKVSQKHRLTAKDGSAILSYAARVNMLSGHAVYDMCIADQVNIGNCKKIISFHDRAYSKERKDLLLSCCA
jgi:hypothetical protein